VSRTIASLKNTKNISIISNDINKVLITKNEACTGSTQLTKEVESAFFINIISGGVFGSSTDYGTEKMWKYQDSVTITCS